MAQFESEDAVFREIRSVISQFFGAPAAQIERSTSALEVNGWDSLSHTMLIMAIEERFDLELPVERLFALKNVGDLAGLVWSTKSSR